MTPGEEIAAQVAAAYRQAAAATGRPDFAIILEKPGTASGPESDQTYGPPTYQALAGIDLDIMSRDATGTLTGDTTRMLRVEAGSGAPHKGGRVNVGGKLANGIVTGGTWHEIDAVATQAPAGVALFHTLTLAT